MRRFRRASRFIVPYIALIVSASAVYGYFANKDRIDENEKTRTALCALRDKQQRQVEGTEDFLAHPERFPSFNDPKTLALIAAQLKDDKDTVAVLDILDC